MERHSATLAQETENDLGLQIESPQLCRAEYARGEYWNVRPESMQSADHLRTLKFLGYSNFA